MANISLFSKVILGVIFIDLLLSGVLHLVDKSVFSTLFLGIAFFISFTYVFTIAAISKFERLASHKILLFLIIAGIVLATINSLEHKFNLSIGAIFLLSFFICLGYDLTKSPTHVFKVSKKPQKAWQNEHDVVASFLFDAATSIFLISIGFYLAGLYPTQVTGFVFDFSLILIGVLYYLFSRSGKEVISGLVDTYITGKKKFPSQTKSLNVHLGFAWILSVATILLTFWIPLRMINAQVVDYSALSNAAMSIMLGESMFATLIAIILGKIKMKSSGMIYLLAIGIFTSIIVLQWVAFELPLLYIMPFMNLTILSLYALIGMFLYQLKRTYDKKSKRARK